MQVVAKEIELKEKVFGFTPKEAAELIGCSEYTIKDLVRRHKIPHYRIGVRIMFSRPALEKWVTDQEKRNYRTM